MQSDGLTSTLSPVVYADIALSIKINTQKIHKHPVQQLLSYWDRSSAFPFMGVKPTDW